MTPTARSLKYLRAQGFHAYVVERWIPRARVRKDVAGFMDILAWRGEPPCTLAVQATTGSNVSHRLDKISNRLSGQEQQALAEWKALGNGVVVHGWSKSRGRKWTVREVPV